MRDKEEAYSISTPQWTLASHRKGRAVLYLPGEAQDFLLILNPAFPHAYPELLAKCEGDPKEDPSSWHEEISKIAEEEGASLEYIPETHGYILSIRAASPLARKYKAAKIAKKCTLKCALK